MLHPNITKLELKSLTDLEFGYFDEVIDVRSPAEYNEDHIPGAINLPVLDDQQRHQVGLEHKLKGPFFARRMGAQIISENIAAILKEHLATRDKDFKPLIYCWRGGKRSGALAEICRQIGWQTTVLHGGYKSYRNLVVNSLYQNADQIEIILLGGYTATGKTEILESLESNGMQVLNLEHLAEHRGSVFGETHSIQPSQKKFESRINEVLRCMDSSQPIIVEAESNKIGQVSIPPALWGSMKNASRINIQAPLEARVQYCLQKYSNLVRNNEDLNSLLGKLSSFHSRKRIEEWNALVKSNNFEELVSQLLHYHYDPRYGSKDCIDTITMKDLTKDSIQKASKNIADIINRKY
ncbi:MAG: tRNA 2-selenouridine(34) synthase MnmH [Rhodobacteraceae bacterium]|nr:tRNA 2-selenouridine(34) synthase MnmH [Paracoccaceae bacterium]MYF45555.1 tRNA 2-selenouridine(34) synthase MnmH [Paracoccaceae bacterium]MYG09718.1 tRNA 2-selenouridine(34) synthase MnmH [Paracoccaceae bacterium]MYI90818.1 tRNA 2-selenouridine(34) synthase MnmH [Paracoccaceae bacterium]